MNPSEPPDNVRAELESINTYLNLSHRFNWEDPFTYKALIYSAMKLMDAAVLARLEVLHKDLKG